MSQSGADSIIHRKAQVARDEFAVREMSAAKALRLTMAKSADTLFGLGLVVRTVEQTAAQLPDIEELAGDDDLLILLDGSGGERGALKLDLQFVAALIEAQLIGTVRQGDADQRPFTQTDAAISQPLINAVLEGFDQMMQEAGLTSGAEGFRFGDRVDDGRMLALALDALDYDIYRLAVDFGPGAKTGKLELFLPKSPVELNSITDDGRDALTAKLEENALNAPVILDAVLARVQVPLSEAGTWQPGSLIPLPPDTMSEAHLLGAKGHIVAKVKLGQLNGFRAVKLVPPVSDDHHESADDAALQLGADQVEDAIEVTVEDVHQIGASDPVLEDPLAQPPDLLEESLLADMPTDMPELASDWSELAGQDAGIPLDPGDIAADPLADLALPMADLETSEGDGELDMVPMAMAEISLDD